MTDQEISNIKTDLETCKMNMSLMNRSLYSLPGRVSEGNRVFSRLLYDFITL